MAGMVHVARVRGDAPEQLHIATDKDVDRPRVRKAVVRPSAPPQAEMLATEYVSNLQQQNFFLDSAIRELQSQLNDGDGGGSRRTALTSDLEAHVTAESLERRAAELMSQVSSISDGFLRDMSEEAVARENESLKRHEAVFVEQVGALKEREVEACAGERLAAYHGQVIEGLRQQAADRARETATMRAVMESAEPMPVVGASVALVRGELVRLRTAECEAEMHRVLASHNIPPAHVPIGVIRAKNAKLKAEIHGLLQQRDEALQRVHLLLEKSVRLQADLNERKREVRVAKAVRMRVGDRYSSAFDRAKAALGDAEMELAAIARNRQDLKAELRALLAEIKRGEDEQVSAELEMEHLRGLTRYIEAEKAGVDVENERMRMELHAIGIDATKLRARLDEACEAAIAAGEAAKVVRKKMKAQARDPRCRMPTVPPELQAVVDSMLRARSALAS